MIDSWFHSPIYNCKLDFPHNDHLIKKVWAIKNSAPKVNTAWRCDTYNTLNTYNAFVDNDKIVHQLIETCAEHVLEFAKTFGAKCHSAVCKDFWFNISEPGSYQEFHQHSNSHFSLAYYLSTPVNSGNIVFKSFEAISDMYPLPIKDDELEPASFKTCFYPPLESRLLIFRSNLQHMVEKNLSDDNRISVTMNFDLVRK